MDLSIFYEIPFYVYFYMYLNVNVYFNENLQSDADQSKGPLIKIRFSTFQRERPPHKLL